MTEQLLPESLRYILGADRLFENAHAFNRMPNYPPHRVYRRVKDESYVEGDAVFMIDIAVAGFEKEGIEIYVEDSVVHITGTTENDELEGWEITDSNLSSRDFHLKFKIADHIKVGNAEMHNGILSIVLYEEIPEHKKRKVVEIT